MQERNYNNIAKSDMFHTKLAGVTFEGRQDVIRDHCKEGMELSLVREPSNKYDSNAIQVLADGRQIGFLNRDLAAEIAPLIDSGVDYKCIADNITGGGEGMSLGVNVSIVKSTDYRFVSTRLEVVTAMGGEKIFYDPENHDYYDEGNGKLVGASSIAEMFEDTTGLDRACTGTAKKLGISEEQVREMWNDMGAKSRDWGNAVHSTISCYIKWVALHKEYYGNDEKLIPKNPVLKKVLEKFLEKVELVEDVPVLVEALVASKEYNLCGRFDFAQPEDQKFHIYDIKTNESLDKDVKLLAPLDRLVPQTTLGAYQVQLSAYGMMLRDAGLEVDTTATLVHITIDGKGEPQVELRKIKLVDLGVALADKGLRKETK